MAELRRMILPILYRLSGRRYPRLEDELEKMSPEALRELHMLLRDVELTLDQERRTFRPFPGGPKIRM